MSDIAGAVDVGEMIDAAASRSDGNPKFNPQLYTNSAMRGSVVEEFADTMPDRLFGGKPPNLQIQKETPAHRIMLNLKAKGTSNREIARLMGVTEPWVSQVTRQPWARIYMAQVLREAGKDAVIELLKGEMENSVYRLIEVRDDVMAPHSAKIAASNSLLDRYLGKPTVKVENTNRNIELTADDEIERLDARLAELKREEALIVAANNGNAPHKEN